MAVRDRGVATGRARRPCGRAGRHCGAAGPEAPRQDRPGRRPASAPVASTRRRPGVVDTADACVGSPGDGAALQGPGRSAGGMDPAVACHLFHLGVPTIGAALASDEGRYAVAAADLTPATRQAADVALDQIDAANTALAPLKLQIARLSRRQPGCRGLQVHYGVGPLTSVAIWAEMGDTRRFSSSSDAVRHAGLDITVWASDTQRAKGHLSRQGPSVLRWALYEAAMAAAKQASPDHDYWTSLRARLGAQRAALTIARKLARRCHHTLRALGDDAWIDAA